MDPQAPWESKLKRVRTALAREGRIVLLVDEPDAWSPRETYFRTFVSDVWDLVFGGFDTLAVSAGRTPFRVRDHRAIHLDPASDPQGVLAAIDAPVLARAKHGVQSRFAEHLGVVSPLQIRLLVAIAALREHALDRVDITSIEHRTALVGTLVGLVEADHPHLRDLWLRLAAVREPFSPDLLGLVGA